MVKVIYDHSDPDIQYDNNWSLINAVNGQQTLYGRSYHTPIAPNARCRFTFEGTRVSVVGYISAPPEPQWQLNYTLDDLSPDARIYQHLNSTGEGFQLFYQSASLEPGKHTLELQLVSGPTNVTGQISIGSFVVVPINARHRNEGTSSSSTAYKDLEYVDDDDPRITYSAGWQDGRHNLSVPAGLSSNSLHLPPDRGEVSIVFNGTSIAVFASYFINHTFGLTFHINAISMPMGLWGGEIRTFPDLADIVNEWPIYSSNDLSNGLYNLTIGFDGLDPAAKFGLDTFIIQSPIPASTGIGSTSPVSSKPPGGHQSFSSGVIAGVIVACLAFTFAVAWLCLLLWRRRFSAALNRSATHINPLITRPNEAYYHQPERSRIETDTAFSLVTARTAGVSMNSMAMAGQRAKASNRVTTGTNDNEEESQPPSYDSIQ
ncbi:hypothetical protein AMATHDRAFT_49025 [Amanita thiersii Skay4041]|uniref:Uncharacterized protein n=1 Tax=Amanita thiersii Skay4041 TaxID=703135 RepID=A0A2A9NL51_9AGAR|nr:hypothetical protein AMATHDRAFT_49025 [Amanita thiersii Skay4041]